MAFEQAWEGGIEGKADKIKYKKEGTFRTKPQLQNAPSSTRSPDRRRCWRSIAGANTPRTPATSMLTLESRGKASNRVNFDGYIFQMAVSAGDAKNKKSLNVWRAKAEGGLAGEVAEQER